MAALFDLTGRTAVVVGGTTGIGRALALGLADAGADVVATGRRPDAVDDVSAAIEARGRRTCGIRRRRRPRGAAQLRERASGIRAAWTSRLRRRRHQARRDARDGRADWNAILDTNLTGMFRTYQVFAPPMIARGAGRLIGIASLASFVGLQEVAAYTASKAAVAGLTRALAVEWARHGLTVNAIAPGVFETDLNRQILKGARGQELLTRTPMGRFGRVEELVGAAVYLASEASTFVTGQMLAVDGGFLASGVNQ
jgi:NAD(P)-dependent dehydrogenase (short-subunit alcohol dehydrogenase family)